MPTNAAADDDWDRNFSNFSPEDMCVCVCEDLSTLELPNFGMAVNILLINC